MADSQPGWVDWSLWEGAIALKGVTIDRPLRSVHPTYPDIVYPIDYGFVNDSESVDGEELDVFVGTKQNGLVAAIFTADLRKGDEECKLLYNCTPEEIYLVNGFINFDPSRMYGRLLLRYPMAEIWSF